MILYIHDQLAAEPSTHERLKKQKQYAHILTLYYLCEVIWNQGKYILLFLARSQGGYKLNTAKIIGTVPVHTHHTCKKLEKKQFCIRANLLGGPIIDMMILHHLKRKRRKKREKGRGEKTKVRMCILSTHTARKRYLFLQINVLFSNVLFSRAL